MDSQSGRRPAARAVLPVLLPVAAAGLLLPQTTQYSESLGLPSEAAAVAHRLFAISDEEKISIAYNVLPHREKTSCHHGSIGTVSVW